MQPSPGRRMTQTAPILLNATRDLARFAARSRFQDIAATVFDHAKLYGLYGIGVALSGASLPWSDHRRELVRAEEVHPGRYSGARRFDSVGAGRAGQWQGRHAFELDDIHKE